MARREVDFNDSTSRLIRVKEAAAVAFQRKQVRGGGDAWYGSRQARFTRVPGTRYPHSGPPPTYPHNPAHPTPPRRPKRRRR